MISIDANKKNIARQQEEEMKARQRQLKLKAHGGRQGCKKYSERRRGARTHCVRAETLVSLTLVEEIMKFPSQLQINILDTDSFPENDYPVDSMPNLTISKNPQPSTLLIRRHAGLFV